MDEARTREQRRKDTLHPLENDIDAWVVTASGDVPCLVPLSCRVRASRSARPGVTR